MPGAKPEEAHQAGAQSGDEELARKLYLDAGEMAERGESLESARTYARAHRLAVVAEVGGTNTRISFLSAIEQYLAVGSDRTALCEAATLVSEFEAELVRALQSVSESVLQCKDEVARALEKAGFDCKEPSPPDPSPPDPPPPDPPTSLHNTGPGPSTSSKPSLNVRQRRMLRGGYGSLAGAGGGLMMLGIGAGVGLRAERDGESQAQSKTAAELRGTVIPRGWAGNGLMISGIVIAAIGLSVGVALIVVARRSSRRLAGRLQSDGLAIAF